MAFGVYTLHLKCPRHGEKRQVCCISCSACLWVLCTNGRERWALAFQVGARSSVRCSHHTLQNHCAFGNCWMSISSPSCFYLTTASWEVPSWPAAFCLWFCPLLASDERQGKMKYVLGKLTRRTILTAVWLPGLFCNLNTR